MIYLTENSINKLRKNKVNFIKPINTMKLDMFLKSKKFKDNGTSSTKTLKNKVEKTKTAKNIQGHVNLSDTCFTAAMKLINQEKIIKKFDASSYKFLRWYLKEFKEDLVFIETIDDLKSLKKGHVIVAYNEKTLFDFHKMNDTFDGTKGIHNTGGEVGYGGHFEIIIENNYPKEIFCLHNSYKSNEPGIPGTQLELMITNDINLFKKIVSQKSKAKMLLIDVKKLEEI